MRHKTSKQPNGASSVQYQACHVASRRISDIIKVGESATTRRQVFVVGSISVSKTGTAGDWRRRNLDRSSSFYSIILSSDDFPRHPQFTDVLHYVIADKDQKSSSSSYKSKLSANSESTQKKTQSFLRSQIMHQAIPYSPASWISSSNQIRILPRPVAADRPTFADTVSQNAVVIFGRRGCCLSHVVNRLLLGHGVNPAVFEVEEGQNEVDVLKKLFESPEEKEASEVQFPIVFVGGKMLGGLETVMAAHISGDLVPTLKAAGALWL